MGNTEVRLYNRIAVLRAERSLSRQSVADAIGVNYQTIGYIERGDYSPASIWHSSFLNCSACPSR